MTVKYLELTNHNPLLKLMIICKAEIIFTFSRRKKIQLRK